ncbi:MAG TPA: hypothetical protein VHN13_16935 [Candidatus Tectomicrobia bacterium]|jgi:hypothetical protein|nr:hypothetical protein [Candidatus Tectomicrobia bacterium]
MKILQRVVGGVISLLILVSLLATLVHTVEAASQALQFTHGRKPPPGSVHPSFPQAGRPLYSPPVFMDRSAPMSVRPFAQPFSDRGPSMADRPLAPIGGGAQVAPGPTPFVWCQGAWVRVDNPPHRCPAP